VLIIELLIFEETMSIITISSTQYAQLLVEDSLFDKHVMRHASQLPNTDLDISLTREMLNRFLGFLMLHTDDERCMCSDDNCTCCLQEADDELIADYGPLCCARVRTETPYLTLTIDEYRAFKQLTSGTEVAVDGQPEQVYVSIGEVWFNELKDLISTAIDIEAENFDKPVEQIH
jgi:hypothetical protein